MNKLENKIPPPLVLALSLLLMWGLQNLQLAEQLAFSAPTVMGIALILLGILIAVAGVVEFRRVKTTVNPLKPESASHLVVSGIFRITRNPMYLGMLLVSLGAVVLYGNWITLIGTAFLFFFLNRFQIKPEEKAMRSLFGDEFKQYAQNVRRWL